MPSNPDPIIDKSNAIRKFDLPSLNSQIDKAINSLPLDAHGAVVGIVDTKGVHLAIIGKAEVGPGILAWTVITTKPYNGKLDFEGQVRYSW